MSSYRSIHAIAQELDRIERNDPESILYGVWNAILSFQFPTHASVWAEGVDQLCQYLSSTHGRRRPSDRSPVYGIVAVGKYMRVYKYDDVNESVLNWSPNPRRLKKGNLWHLEENYEQVQLILDHIRDNH
ncbi:hypothetical protein N7447_001689 [Penicillium robsamsonii]|uniref:uncharacterized protein n=1 Tax=Penicillium robsamsonii TaxID=1792511 RepID=UPI00254762E4|nr:uncharacterized protein N7447_001689 [Penicillium robsamsonii]KAJ5835663.1 hypothetical protein N7447_001689 [Penicillium robsamsonii]